MVVGTPLIAHVEIRRVAWKWLVTNEPSGLSLCRPYPCIVVVVVIVVAKPVSQPSSGGMDGWMDVYIPTT